MNTEEIRYLLLWAAPEALFGTPVEIKFRISQRLAFFIGMDKGLSGRFLRTERRRMASVRRWPTVRGRKTKTPSRSPQQAKPFPIVHSFAWLWTTAPNILSAKTNIERSSWTSRCLSDEDVIERDLSTIRVFTGTLVQANLHHLVFSTLFNAYECPTQ